MSAKKFIREVERRTGIRITSISHIGTGHLRLCLDCGAAIFTASTPSDHRNLQNTLRDIRRVLNHHAQGGHRAN